MDRWGRKAGVFYCAFFSIIGGALLCGAQNVGMFIAARFIAGWGSWGFLAVSMFDLSSHILAVLRSFPSIRDSKNIHTDNASTYLLR